MYKTLQILFTQCQVDKKSREQSKVKSYDVLFYRTIKFMIYRIYTISTLIIIIPDTIILWTSYD